MLADGRRGGQGARPVGGGGAHRGAAASRRVPARGGASNATPGSSWSGGSGERPIVGAILGSVPHKLLHRSDVPVLVVPAGDE